MKKAFLFKAMAVIIAMTASFSLFSCSDDDEAEDPTALREVNTSYTVDVSEDYLYFYDIKVTYGYGNTEGMTQSIATNTWASNEKLQGLSEIPSHFFCKVVVTPKNPVPAIDPEQTYKFSFSYKFSVNGVLNNGQSSMLNSSTNQHSISFKGENVQPLLDKGERTIANYSYTRN